MKAPSAFGTSPKYDNKYVVCGFSQPLVGFGGGRRGQATLAPDASAGEVNVLRELQSQSQEELGALLPSVLDKAFKGEL